ncbi:MAG TPA: aldehyde dehydrogenase family protein, partial [Pirellulales bacterium]|nr:aldehyde dehydrogenase family protein [Pirellulales bacterium]
MTIDGKPAGTSGHIGVINPATGEVFAQAPDATRSDLDRAVASAKAAFKLWKKKPFAERRALVERAGDVILENADDLG